MKFAYKLLPLVIAASQSLPAMAAPANFMNARAFAMGGTGVSSARPGAAGFYNPALLSVKQEEKNDAFSLFLPSVNARVAYDDDLINKLDNYKKGNHLNKLKNAINSYNNEIKKTTPDKAQISNDLGTVINEAKAIDKLLNEIDLSAAQADIGGANSFAMPGKNLGMGLTLKTSIRLAAILHYNDSSFITNDIIANAESFKNTIDNGGSTTTLKDLTNLVENGNNLSNAADHQLESNAVIVGAALSEVGLPMSHDFTFAGHSYALGITPKLVRADLFNYQVDPNNFDSNNFDDSNTRRSETSFNLDIGVARQFGATKAWTAGLSIRNLIPKTYKFKENILKSVSLQPEMKLEPQVTAGVSHTGDWHTVAIDLDLTKNRKFGFEDDEQYLSVGGEFDVFDMLQLRAGFRYNIASDSSTAKAIQESSAVTAGLGLDLFSFNLAVSGYASSKQKGAALELGIVF